MSLSVPEPEPELRAENFPAPALLCSIKMTKKYPFFIKNCLKITILFISIQFLNIFFIHLKNLAQILSFPPEPLRSRSWSRSRKFLEVGAGAGAGAENFWRSEPE